MVICMREQTDGLRDVGVGSKAEAWYDKRRGLVSGIEGAVILAGMTWCYCGGHGVL